MAWVGRRVGEGWTKAGRRQDEARTKQGRSKDEARTVGKPKGDDGRTKPGRCCHGNVTKSILILFHIFSKNWINPKSSSALSRTWLNLRFYQLCQSLKKPLEQSMERRSAEVRWPINIMEEFCTRLSGIVLLIPGDIFNKCIVNSSRVSILWSVFSSDRS